MTVCEKYLLWIRLKKLLALTLPRFKHMMNATTNTTKTYYDMRHINRAIYKKNVKAKKMKVVDCRHLSQARSLICEMYLNINSNVDSMYFKRQINFKGSVLISMPLNLKDTVYFWCSKSLNIQKYKKFRTYSLNQRQNFKNELKIVHISGATL